MEIALFFSPLKETFFSTPDNTLGGQVEAFVEEVPHWKDKDIVILGVPEYRGEETTSETRNDLAEIREAFYQQKNNFSQLKIADIGDLNLGLTLQDTYLRLEEVIANLIKENCLPIILGGSHDLTYAQYMAYASLEKYVHLINIDARIDLDVAGTSLKKEAFLGELFTQKPNYLFGYSHVGYHSFLTDTEELKLLEEVGFDCFRVGELKSNIHETEPIIRNGNLISIDIDSIRASDSPCSFSPFGFTAEEACQMMWYAGHHEHMSSLGLYGYSSQKDIQKRSAKGYAAMLWYFIDGFYSRMGKATIFDSNYTKYIVPFESHTICFYKDNLSDKWWLEIESDEGANKLERNVLVPCSHTDYQDATEGKLPDRWVQAFTRLSL